VKRAIIPAILFAVLLLGGYGCMQNDPVRNEPARNINDAALSYMEQKYGEEFEYAAPWGNSMSGTHELIVSCASLPGQEIVVQIENYKRDDKVFRDNYLAVKYRQQTADFVNDCAVEVFGRATIFYEAANDGLSSSLPADASFDEFLADTRVPLGVMIEVKASDLSSREQAEKVAKLIAERSAGFYLTLVAVDDDVYGALDRKSLNERIPSRQFVECASITWLDGELRTEWLGKE
jgi:hypothetical protein